MSTKTPLERHRRAGSHHPRPGTAYWLLSGLVAIMLTLGTPVQARAQSAVMIPDANFASCITDALSLPRGSIVTEGQLATLTRLSCMGRNISDLTGAGFLTSITSLELDQNQITGIGPLAGLASLTWLSLYQNQVADLGPLAGLTRLTVVYLDRNRISDVRPLSGLTQIDELGLCNNQISDLSPLAGWLASGRILKACFSFQTVTLPDTTVGVGFPFVVKDLTGASVPLTLPAGVTYSGGVLTYTTEGLHTITFADTGAMFDGTILQTAGPAPTSTDTTAPVIIPIITGTKGANGWYTSDVSVTWQVSDPESAVTSSPCAGQTITQDTTGVTFTCTATSAGGASSQSVTIKRDATSPTLAPTVSPAPVVLNGNATAAVNAADPTSGVATSDCDPVTTGTVGSFSTSCHASDMAGNTATGTVQYRVVAPFGAFGAPLPQRKQVKAGSAIPVTFTLRDANGPQAPAGAQALADNGQVRAVLTGTQDGGGEVLATAACTWNAAEGQFECVVKTPGSLPVDHPYYITVQESSTGQTDWFTAPSLPDATGSAVNPVRINLT